MDQSNKARIDFDFMPLIKFSVSFFIVLFALKISGYVDWSWFVVTAPLWLMLAVGSGIVTTLFLVASVVVMAIAIAKQVQKIRG